jgi:hypothetical protein
MRNKVVFVTGISLLVLAIGLFLCVDISYDKLNLNATEEPPTKTAFWVGAPDFGCWYDILEIDSTTHRARIKVYDDYDRRVWADGIYVDRNRVLSPFSKEKIRREIFDFDINNGNIKIKEGCDCLEIDSFIYCGFEIIR